MDEGLLRRIRAHVRARRILVSAHARLELRDDDFTAHDLEHALLSGYLAERQRDSETGEWKYLLEGAALDGALLAAVVKWTAEGILYVITVCRIHP